MPEFPTEIFEPFYVYEWPQTSPGTPQLSAPKRRLQETTTASSRKPWLGPLKGLRLATAPQGAQHDHKAGRDIGLALLDTNHLLS